MLDVFHYILYYFIVCHLQLYTLFWTHLAFHYFYIDSYKPIAALSTLHMYLQQTDFALLKIVITILQ